MTLSRQDTRTLEAYASGRLSDARQAVADLEAILTDVRYKLARAREHVTRAEEAYLRTLAMLGEGDAR